MLHFNTAVFSRRAISFIGRHSLFLAARVMHRLPLGAALAFGRVLGRLTPYISSKHYRRVLAGIQGRRNDPRAEGDAEEGGADRVNWGPQPPQS